MRSLESTLVSVKIKALKEKLDEIDKCLDTLFSYSCPSELKKKVKKLERTVDWIGNYVEEQTALEPGEELTDSSDSSETDYVIHYPEKKVHKVKCVKKRSSNKKVKRKRYQSRSVNVELGKLSSNG
jgi:hypothetical protein